MAIPLSTISVANTAISLKVNGRPGYRVRIMGANVSYSAAPAAGSSFQFQEGPGLTVRFNLDLASAGPQNLFPPDDGWTFEVGQDVTAVLAAGGVGVVGKINLGVDYEIDTPPQV